MGAEIGAGITGAALGIGGGLIGGALNQHYNQQNLEAQIAGQKEMTDYNQASAFDMWNKTNYEAQLAHMEKAGLSVGLMYGKGGGGASATIGSPNGSISQPQNKVDIQKGLDMGLQAMGIQSQIDLNKSQAVKNQAETAEVQARTPTYEKNMSKTDAEITKLANDNNVSIETAKKIIQDVEQSKSTIQVQQAEIPKIQAETKNIGAETNKITTLTPIEKNIMQQELKGAITKNVYLDRKEREELNNLVQDVVNKKAQVDQGQQKIDIEKFLSEMKADYPGLFDVAGHVIDTELRQALKLMGMSPEVSKRKVK